MGRKGQAATTTSSSGKAAVKEEPSLIQESNEKVFGGPFASEVHSLCTQHSHPQIAVYQRGCGNGSRFAFVVDVEPTEQELVLAIHVRGWLFTESVAAILSEAFSSNCCKALCGIHFWNVGLTSSTLATVVHLAIENNIRELTLDGNVIAAEPLVNMLSSKSSLLKLSLKSCNITNQFIQEIMEPLTNNRTLLHLNLSSNCIGDDGCIALASSLRLNRTLLTLSLTGNYIGDRGAAALAKVLSKFPLEHHEIVQRRKLRLSKIEDGRPPSAALDVQPDRGRVSSPRGKSPTSATALHKTLSKSDKVSGAKSKKGEKNKDDKLKKDDRSKKSLEARKSKTIKETKGGKKGEAGGFDSPRPEPAQIVNALELPVKNEHGQLYLPGNVALAYLALAYNEIGSAGMRSMLEAVQLQLQYSEFGPGLLKLSLDHNVPKIGGIRVQDNSEQVLKEISTLLANKSRSDEEAGSDKEIVS